MKTKYKIVLWLCLFLIVIIVSCLILIKIESNKKADDLADGGTPAGDQAGEAISSATATSAVRNVAEEDGAKKQSQTSFEIYFPASWGNIEVVEGDLKDGVKIVEYKIKTTDDSYKEGSATIITVRQYAKSSMDKIGTSIASSDDYDFHYTTWEKAPSDLMQITEKELASVLETFRVLN